jgi:prolyl oligopeptidase
MALASGSWAIAGSPPGPPPPPPAPSPVTETLFGTELRDPYRGFERLDPATVDWIKREGAYARSVLDAIPPRAALQGRLAAFEAQFAAVDSYQGAGGRAFFRRRDPGSDDFDLVVRDRQGARKLVDIGAIRAADGGAPYAINYYLPSPDGSKVAVGISRAGTEDANLRVYDVATGARIGGDVDRAQFGFQAWSGDSSILYFNRLRALSPGQDPLDRYKNTTIEAWDLRSPPRTEFDPTAAKAATVLATDTPRLTLSPASPVAALSFENAADPNLAVWVAPKAQIGQAAAWRPIISHADGVTAFQLSGSRIFLLSDAGAPTFKVLELDAGNPIARARTVLAAAPDRIIESIHAASDGLYVVVRHGLYASMLRVRPDGDPEDIRLPGEGQISEAFSDPARPGVTIAFESWNRPSRIYVHRPGDVGFVDLNLAPKPQVRIGETVRDLEASAPDGVNVPLTVLTPPIGHERGPMVVLAYGSYGISLLPHFNPLLAEFVREGGAYAVCHVRGGGELGEAWRLGGKDANKPNTWRDLIACSEDLIRRGLVAKGRLFLEGGSAGGIAVGRAAQARPDLFAGVIDNVPPANMARLEFMPDGALETQEFGTIKTEAGFRNLLAMDTYQHVADNVRYPPFLIGMGLNDPRIAAWQPAKLAARLLGAGPTSVLLRVDLDNGHGVGSTRMQTDQLFADMFAFVFWRSGRARWAPDAAPPAH